MKYSTNAIFLVTYLGSLNVDVLPPRINVTIVPKVGVSKGAKKYFT